MSHLLIALISYTNNIIQYPYMDINSGVGDFSFIYILLKVIDTSISKPQL